MAFLYIANQNNLHMIEFFPLFLDFGPDGLHSFKRAYTLPIKDQQQGINPFQQYMIQYIRSLIGGSVPQMNITLKVLFFRSLLVGLYIFDFLYDRVSLLTRYLVLRRNVMLVSVNKWTFPWFYLLFLLTYISRPISTALFGKSILWRTLSTGLAFRGRGFLKDCRGLFRGHFYLFIYTIYTIYTIEQFNL